MLEFLLGVAVLAAFYGVLSVSLDMQAGTTGLMNFGLVGFSGIGAYATGLASMHDFPWPAAIVAGMLVAALAGVGVGLLGRTLGAEYWAIATLALAELLRLVALNAEGITRGPGGISTVAPFFGSASPTERDLLWLGLMLAMLAVCALIAWQLSRTQFGRILRLLREREHQAAAVGHDVVRAKVRVLLVSAPMAALAGSLYAHYITFVGPQDLAPFATFLVFTMVIVGGLGSIWGAVLGAFLIQFLYEITRFIDDVIDISAASAGGIRILVVGVAMLGFLLFCPAGIIPERLRKIDAAR